MKSILYLFIYRLIESDPKTDAILLNYLYDFKYYLLVISPNPYAKFFRCLDYVLLNL